MSYPQRRLLSDVARILAAVVSARACVVAVAVASLCGCGDSGQRPAQKPAPAPVTTLPGQPGSARLDRAGVHVVRLWSDALRRGDVARATSYFAIPSRAFNGDGLITLRSRADAREFNDSLPCGARLIAVEPGSKGYFIATFVLTERPGPGTCGAGSTATARTAFRVRAGKITDWIRVGDLPQPTGSQA